MTALEELIGFAEARGMALHTVQVHRGGEPVLRAAAAPLTLDTPQRMYSVTKSLTALAIGLLVGDGVVDLAEPLVAHFPDLAPFHPYLAAATVRDVLTMRGPHASTTYKRYDGPWLESYFRVPPSHLPGTIFTYDTSASYTLAALVERHAGCSLVDFLRPRLLDPLGLSADLRVLPGGDGHASGGSGLVCSPDDLRRIADLLLAGGRAPDGTALLPADYLAEMVAPQADTGVQGWGHQLSGGYGLQLWRPVAGGWLMFGMGGQIVYADPARALTVVVTADTQASEAGDQQLVDLVVGRLTDGWAHQPATTEIAPLRWPAPPHHAGHATDPTGVWRDGVETLTVSGSAARGRLTVAGEGGWTLPFEPGATLRVTEDGLAAASGIAGPAMITAGWSSPGTLDVRVDVVGDELAVMRLRLVLGDGVLTLRRRGHGEAVAASWNGTRSYRRA